MLALASVVLSRSVTVIELLIAVAASFSVYEIVLPLANTGASFTAVILIVDVTVFEFAALSFTVKVIERAVVVGLSELFVYLTARNADCHCASVAVLPDEESESTPLALVVMVMLPMVEPSFVNDRLS